MNRINIQKTLWLVVIRAAIAAITCSVFYFAFAFLASLLPTPPSAVQVMLHLGPDSTSELIGYLLSFSPRILVVSLLWSALLIITTSVKRWLDFGFAVGLAILPGILSIIEIPNTIAAISEFDPNSVAKGLAFTFVVPAALLFASFATWLVVDRLELKKPQ